MEDADFSDAFCRFIQAHVPTVEAAEKLIALHDRGVPLSGLESEGPHVVMLAKAWRERPVTLVRIIYALRDSKVKSFADAFKLRK